MESFERISLRGWRQFQEVDIDLSKQVTILTGQNGCGKTTLLNILSKHFGWNLNFVATPRWGKKRVRRFWSDALRTRDEELVDEPDNNATTAVGEVRYSSGQVCKLSTNTVVGAQYQLQYADQQPVIGLHIPSHRPAATYHPVNQIPTNPKTIQQHYQNFQQLLFQTYGASGRQNPGIALKESIISLALFGYGNQAVTPNIEYRDIYESFQRVLSDVLPPDIGFERLEVRMPEVVLVTRSGDFALDAMSGGINALFGVAWQIHMYGADKQRCTVTIDEPENHLHPSMQRSFLPSLARAFPNHRFIVATHSPFVVSSQQDSNVYGLTFTESGKVASSRLGEADLAGTPNRVLREILDVPSNLPIWVEDRIRAIVDSADPDDPAALARALMAEVSRLGVSDALQDLDIG